MATVLKNISEIRRFFHRNEDPIYFISATNFNLLGLDEWVKNFKYICYIDCYGGKHPNVFAHPSNRMRSSSRLRTSTTTCCSTKRSSTSLSAVAVSQSLCS